MKATRYFAGALMISTAATFAQGSLTPPGAPAPMMKSLDQIEARTPISSAPFTITSPGSYYLTTNLTSAANAIVIQASGVTLDLGGWTIFSSAPDSAVGGAAISFDGFSDITIVNGHIRSGVTNNGAGVYSGPGFANGITWNYGNFPIPSNVRVSGVSVAGVLYSGIYLGDSSSLLVESCTVGTSGSYGIYASTVNNCWAVDCGSYAIVGERVTDCHGEGYDNGNGVGAIIANNCYGSSAGSGYGLLASYSASSCYSQSHSGTGIAADVAENCFGSCNLGSGYGIFATTALNCHGSSYNGPGLSAFIATGCRGQPLSVTHNLNSF